MSTYFGSVPPKAFRRAVKTAERLACSGKSTRRLGADAAQDRILEAEALWHAELRFHCFEKKHLGARPRYGAQKKLRPWRVRGRFVRP